MVRTATLIVALALAAPAAAQTTTVTDCHAGLGTLHCETNSRPDPLYELLHPAPPTPEMERQRAETVAEFDRAEAQIAQSIGNWWRRRSTRAAASPARPDRDAVVRSVAQGIASGHCADAVAQARSINDTALVDEALATCKPEER